MGIRDSKLVKSAWKNKNYIIQTDDSVNTKKCAIYFSSNAIYYPDTEDAFFERIIKRDSYEWYGKRVSDASKHIFVRDVFKCWYVKGINEEYCDIFKLTEFLKKETEGYDVVTIGSSAGAYAAIICGSLLHSKMVYAFNPQIKLDNLKSQYSLLANLCGRTNDINNFIDSNVEYFYFFSCKSIQDIEQRSYLGQYNNMHVISFNTSRHGIPFLTVVLQKIFSLSSTRLVSFSYHVHNPFMFSLRLVGIRKCILGLYHQYKSKRITNLKF